MIKLLDLLAEGKSGSSLKIDNDYVKGEVRQVRPGVFAVIIKDRYQRTMLFCRYTEFYKSPYDEIRNKSFTWEKFMETYRENFDENLFTYPKDWDGFGLPSEAITKGIKAFSKDSGPYDEIMSKIYSYCNKSLGSSKKKWYLIGTDSKESKTMDHEIAHALYSINNEYKKSCDKLISDIKAKDYQTLKKKILAMGYIDENETIKDEIQSSMSTGLPDGLNTKELKKYQAAFIDNFKKFSKESLESQ